MSGRHLTFDWRAPLCLGALAAVCTLLLWHIAGVTLNFFLVSTAVVCLTATAFGGSCRSVPDTVALALSGTAGVGVVWSWAHHGGRVELEQVLECAGVVASLVALELSACRLMGALGIERTFAGAAVFGLTLTWLLWPVWTTIAPPAVVWVHPLLSVNGIFATDLGLWTEQPVAYPWIALGQDVSYRVPVSPWPCILWQCGAAILATILTVAMGWAKRRSRAQGLMSVAGTG